VRQHSFKINEEYHNGSYILHFLWPNPKYNDLFESLIVSAIEAIKKDTKNERVHNINLVTI